MEVPQQSSKWQRSVENKKQEERQDVRNHNHTKNLRKGNGLLGELKKDSQWNLKIYLGRNETEFTN